MDLKLTIFVVLAVYSKADNNKFVYRKFCLGLGVGEREKQALVQKLEKIRGKLNLDENDEALAENILANIIGDINRRAKIKSQMYSRSELEEFENNKDKIERYCYGLSGVLSIPQKLYEYLKEYREGYKMKSPLMEFFNNINQVTRHEPEDNAEVSMPIKFSMNFESKGDPVFSYINRALRSNERRAAYARWVEIANGVHKTELLETPQDNLQQRLLHLIALKQTMENGN